LRTYVYNVTVNKKQKRKNRPLSEIIDKRVAEKI